MITIDNTLSYLRESLANHHESGMCRQIMRKLEKHHYADELTFVKDLGEEEMAYLNAVLEQELDYARSAQDGVRLRELNEVYERLPLM